MRKTMRKSMKRTQKLWNMKGCSKSNRNLGGKKKGGCWNMKKRGGARICKKCGHGCRCGPICNCRHKCPGNCYLNGKRSRKQRGGSCGCGIQMGGCGSCLGGGIQMGGGINNSGTPLVGSPWTPKINDWPGVSGKDGQTNYFADNKYLVDPQRTMISERDQQTYMAGGSSRKRRGGGIIPQDLVNLGRSMVYGLGSAYNTLNGYSGPVSPLPYKDQLINTPSSKALGY
jgi:hypothetical protein